MEDRGQLALIKIRRKLAFMNDGSNWINELNEVGFSRSNNHWFELRRVCHNCDNWREKNHWMAKMKLHGSRGKIMAKATGKTPNKAIENLLKSEYRGTDKTVGDIMGINAEQADNQN